MPPVAVTLALPLLPPKQLTLVVAVAVAANADAGCVIATLAVAVHPFASVMVTVYEPAERLLADAVVLPLDQL